MVVSWSLLKPHRRDDRAREVYEWVEIKDLLHYVICGDTELHNFRGTGWLILNYLEHG